MTFDIVAKGSIYTPGITLSINPITVRYLFENTAYIKTIYL